MLSPQVLGEAHKIREGCVRSGDARQVHILPQCRLLGGLQEERFPQHLSLLPQHSVRTAEGTQLCVGPPRPDLASASGVGPTGGWVRGGWSPPRGSSSQPRQALTPIPTVPHPALATCRILQHLNPRPFAAARTRHAPPAGGHARSPAP